MRINSRHATAALLAVFLCSCAGTTIKQKWKAPGYTGGPVRKVAMLAVDQRTLLRQALENRYATQFIKQGESAIITYDLLSLEDIKGNKEAAAERFRKAGADSVLIVRLVDAPTYSSQVQTLPTAYRPEIAGFDYYGWYNYFSLAYLGMGTTWSTMQQDVYLDNSLYELKTGQRVWSGLTKTVFREDTDRLDEIDPLVRKVFKGLQEDGLVQ